MKRGVGLFAVAALTVAAAPAAASTFVAVSDVELVRGAAAVVQGRVVSQESRWDATGRVVVTEALVQVRDVLAGSAPNFVTVRTAGGTVGDFAVEAVGFPRFRDREKVILFLEATGDGAYRVLGYQQGHFEVVKRLDGVRLAVPRTEDGASFLTADGRLLPERRSMLLKDFKRGVREIARNQSNRLGR